ncbi:hypothetical protein N7477_008921 [Penicillium maclennaniae]|nr:hypothetical protein N7477_008921 [Penicillium maclennaniae]
MLSSLKAAYSGKGINASFPYL